MDDIIVNDTNIFIDLHSCSLLDSFFKLPYNMHTTDFVMSELTQGDQYKDVVMYCEKAQLTVKSFSPKEMACVGGYYTNAKKVCNVSIHDCSVLVYTKMLKRARLLTGDKSLRKRAEGEGLLVSGVLFVFDELVKHAVISPKEAALRLTGLRDKNIRLPQDEVDRRLVSWEDGEMVEF